MVRPTNQTKPNHILFPPPRILTEGELPPIIEPPFRDMTPFPAAEIIEEYEEVKSNPIENPLTQEIISKAQSVAEANEQVNQLLAGKTYIPIGVSYYAVNKDKNENEDPKEDFLKFVLYDYTDNESIDVYLDKYAQSVIRIEKLYYQPPTVEKESIEAIELAKKDQRLAGKITEDLIGSTLLVSPADPDDKYYRHRQLDVRFCRSDERVPMYMAIVDLSTKMVLKAGPACPDKERNRGKQEG
jgi:hypothetical protein